MRSSAVALGGLLGAACLYANPDFGAGGESTSGVAGSSTSSGATNDATTGAGVTTGADATTGGAVTAGTTDVSTGAPATGATTGALPDLGGSQYPHYAQPSCRTLKEYVETTQGQTAVSGYYNLELGGQSVDVYCDMEIAGGGWTLVGRSAGVVQQTGFGWLPTRGAVDDDAQPYSLGLMSYPVNFTAILLGDYASGKQWGGNAYQFTVASGYVQDNLAKMVELGAPTIVLGDCTPESWWMFRFGGFTTSDQAFFFRDLDMMDNAYFGLLTNGFYLHTYEGCPQAGDLNKKQGMLLVR